MSRRVLTVNDWIGPPFPAASPYEAYPEVLTLMLDATELPWTHHELIRRLIQRARTVDKSYVVRASIQSMSRDWRIPRSTLARWLDDLQTAGLVRLRRAEVDLDPLCVRLRMTLGSSHGRDEVGDGTRPTSETNSSTDGTSSPMGGTNSSTGGNSQARNCRHPHPAPAPNARAYAREEERRSSGATSAEEVLDRLAAADPRLAAAVSRARPGRAEEGGAR